MYSKIEYNPNEAMKSDSFLVVQANYGGLKEHHFWQFSNTLPLELCDCFVAIFRVRLKPIPIC
jgi:hypothetical protein